MFDPVLGLCGKISGSLCEKTQEASPILYRAGAEGREEDAFISASVFHYPTLFLIGSKVH